MWRLLLPPSNLSAHARVQVGVFRDRSLSGATQLRGMASGLLQASGTDIMTSVLRGQAAPSSRCCRILQNWNFQNYTWPIRGRTSAPCSSTAAITRTPRPGSSSGVSVTGTSSYVVFEIKVDTIRSNGMLSREVQLLNDR